MSTQGTGTTEGKPGRPETALATTKTYSQRFTSMVTKEFGSQIGTLELDHYQSKLAQHLFIGIDKALTTLEAKRLKDGHTNKAPMIWKNVNMTKLSIDSVHRIHLGLDALIPNHIHVVPYFNTALQAYDLDLTIGYAGKDYYRRKMAVVEPLDIRYELVHETDVFRATFKDCNNDVESYVLEIKNPFKRGKVIGGFGYIEYQDSTMNRLVLVDMDSMNKSKAAAKAKTFWNAHPERMQYVVLVRRTTDCLNIDPRKVNASYMSVELDDNHTEIEANANQELIDIDEENVVDVEALPEPEPEKELTPEVNETKEAEEKPQIEKPVFIHCPVELNKSQPRKSTKTCAKCKNKDKCESYQLHTTGEIIEPGQAQEDIQAQPEY